MTLDKSVKMCYYSFCKDELRLSVITALKGVITDDISHLTKQSFN